MQCHVCVRMSPSVVDPWQVTHARRAYVTPPDRFTVEYELHASLKGSELKSVKRPKLCKVVLPVVLPGERDEARFPIICAQHCGQLVLVSMIKLVWQTHWGKCKSTYDPCKGADIIKYRTGMDIKTLVPLLNPNTNHGHKQPKRCLVCERHFCRCC